MSSPEADKTPDNGPGRKPGGAQRPAPVQAQADPGSPLWAAVDRLVGRALAPGGGGLDGLSSHKLVPLAAGWYERSGLPVPASVHEEQRSASLAFLIASPLVRRIRDSVDGELLMLKGPEVAALYPPGGRRFSDVDVLSPQAQSVQDGLLAAGFIEVDHEAYMANEDHHHLHPIRFPAIWLNVEVHEEPNWPVLATKPPPLREILEAAEPSALGIDGVSAPTELHHALLLASHAWRHEPLHRLRDLLDIAVLAEGLSRAELANTAERWGIGRLWNTTWATIEALFYGGPETVPMKLWAPHLKTARDRTVLENHLQHWLSSYWELPPHRALAQTARTVRKDLSPEGDETWGEKLSRTADAIRHPRSGAAARRRNRST